MHPQLERHPGLRCRQVSFLTDRGKNRPELLRRRTKQNTLSSKMVSTTDTFIQTRFHPMTFSTNNGFIQKITCGTINIVRVCVKASPAEVLHSRLRSLQCLIKHRTEKSKESPEILRKLRARFRAIEGEDPMKTEEVTDDQLSVVHSLTQAGISPHADFGVWRPFGQRAAKSLKFVSHFLDNTGSWRCKEIPGPDSIVTWEACWLVFRTAAIMCDLATPAVLDRHAAAFRARTVGTCACWRTPGVEWHI